MCLLKGTFLTLNVPTAAYTNILTCIEKRVKQTKPFQDLHHCASVS